MHKKLITLAVVSLLFSALRAVPAEQGIPLPTDIESNRNAQSQEVEQQRWWQSATVKIIAKGGAFAALVGAVSTASSLGCATGSSDFVDFSLCSGGLNSVFTVGTFVIFAAVLRDGNAQSQVEQQRWWQSATVKIIARAGALATLVGATSAAASFGCSALSDAGLNDFPYCAGLTVSTSTVCTFIAALCCSVRHTVR